MKFIIPNEENFLSDFQTLYISHEGIVNTWALLHFSPSVTKKLTSFLITLSVQSVFWGQGIS